MTLRNFLFIGAVTALVLIPSCKKKDEETTVDPYLDGALYFDMPMFVHIGDEFTLVPSGVTNPTTGNVGYYWYPSWDASSKDTTKTETGLGDGSWSFTVPNEIGNYYVTGFAFAKDYSNLSKTHSFVAVDPTVNVTVTGASYQLDSLTLEDPRDGATYYLATSGGNVWMQNNLYYQGSGVSYENSPVMDKLFGRMYTWEEAVKACPEGWHLPSDAEFALLAGSGCKPGENFVDAAGSLMADVSFIGTKMWAFWPDVTITNKSKFSAIPVGYAMDQEGRQKFVGTNSYATFWTSDGDDETGLYRYMYVDKSTVFFAHGDKKSFRASVRCVKD